MAAPFSVLLKRRDGRVQRRDGTDALPPREQLAADLFYLLRDFDRTCPDVILAEGVEEDGLGLAIMNRLRKAAGYQIITLENGNLHLKNNVNLPSFMLQ